MAESKYEKNMVKMSKEGRRGPGGALMSDELVPGCNVFIMYFWILKMPEPNPNPMHQSFEWHDYDEIIFNVGMDPDNPEILGGETEGYMGHSQQIMNKTTLLYIPANAEHGRISTHSFEKPYIQLAIKLSSNIEKMDERLTREETSHSPDEDYNRYMITEPLRELASPPGTTGRTSPPYTFLNNKLVPDCNVYLEYSWIWDMPTPNPIEMSHAHNYDEIVLNIGADPENIEELGGEIEAYMGGEKQVTDKTSAVYIPKNVEHGPVKWTKFEKPHIQMSIVLGTGEPGEALPGGHKPVN